MKTTLNKIREHSPCASGWEKLLSYLGKTKADDEPLALTTIIDSNGLDDALWCLRAVEGHAKEIRLYAVWCVRQVEHLLKDQRSLDALDVAERYANGQATEDELTAAWAAARDVVRSTARAARAAQSATWWAAWYAADAAAQSAAWWAVRAACWAEWDVWDAARHEMKKKQEAELRRICEEG